MKPEEGNQTRVSHDSMRIIENLLAFLLPHHLFFLKISGTDSGIPFFCFASSPNLSVDAAAGCTNHSSRLPTALGMSACHTGRNFLCSIKALSLDILTYRCTKQFIHQFKYRP
jgi:hypothetical protein